MIDLQTLDSMTECTFICHVELWRLRSFMFKHRGVNHRYLIDHFRTMIINRLAVFNDLWHWFWTKIHVFLKMHWMIQPSTIWIHCFEFWRRTDEELLSGWFEIYNSFILSIDIWDFTQVWDRHCEWLMWIAWHPQLGLGKLRNGQSSSFCYTNPTLLVYFTHPTIESLHKRLALSRHFIELNLFLLKLRRPHKPSP